MKKRSSLIFLLPLLMALSVSACGKSNKNKKSSSVSSTPTSSVHVHSNFYHSTENRIEPTCTVDGSYIDITYCGSCRQEVSRETVIIPASGHDYGTPTYTWADDYSTCTAQRVCKIDATHIDKETVNSSYQIIDNATLTEKGSARYTATFTKTGFEKQTVDVEIEKISSANLLDFTLSEDETSYAVKAKATDITGTIIIPDSYKNKPVTALMVTHRYTGAKMKKTVEEEE